MQLNAAASNLVVVWYLIASVLNLAVILGLVIALAKLSAQLHALSARVDPMLSKAETVLSQANSQLERIGTSTSSLLDTTQGVASTVQETTVRTSANISRLVYTPFVGIHALLAGVSHGAKTFTNRSKRNSQKG